MNPPLTLGHRHPLHPVRAGLVFHSGPDGIAGEHRCDLAVTAEVAVAGRHHIDSPALTPSECVEHVEQVFGEQVGFLPTCSAAYLDDDVAPVVGVGRQQQDPQLVLIGHDLRLEPLDLGPVLISLIGLCGREHRENR